MMADSLNPGSAEWRSLIVGDDIAKGSVQAQPAIVRNKAPGLG